MQISTNGLISFQKSFTSPAVENVRPFIQLDDFNQTIIAPFWVNFEPSPQGFIHYRISNSTVDLAYVKNLITDTNPDFCGFEPSSVIVVTWDRLVVPNIASSVS